jgi:hypothetical protein
MRDGEAAAQANDPTRPLPGAGWAADAGVDRRARCSRTIRLPRLSARRNDPPGVAQRGRRRRVLAHHPRWAKSQSGGNGTTTEFIALAERISGQQLDALFDAWLFTAGKPTIATARVLGLLSSSTASQGFTKQWLTGLAERLQKGRF